MKNWLELSVEERSEIKERFNELYDSGKYNLDEIAKKLDLSRERCVQLKSLFFRKYKRKPIGWNQQN